MDGRARRQETEGASWESSAHTGRAPALDARDLNLKTPADPPPEHVLVPDHGYIRDGGYHVAP
jgi:hypothetical protein